MTLFDMIHIPTGMPCRVVEDDITWESVPVEFIRSFPYLKERRYSYSACRMGYFGNVTAGNLKPTKFFSVLEKKPRSTTKREYEIGDSVVIKKDFADIELPSGESPGFGDDMHSWAGKECVLTGITRGYWLDLRNSCGRTYYFHKLWVE